MNKYIKYILLCFFLFLLTGCASENNANISMVSPPNNNKNIILGQWYCEKYDIFDKNIANSDAIYEVLSKNIELYPDNIVFAEKQYTGVSYKLKLVKPDYSLSYEAGITLKDIGIDHNDIQVYSITYKNNLLCEIIYESKEVSYLYYQGILFYLNYVKELDYTLKEDNNNDYSDNYSEDDNNSSQGLLLGLKNTSSNNQNGSNKYRTLWISTTNGTVNDIESRNNILVPRRNGIWEILSDVYKNSDRNIYYEYIFIKALDREVSDEHLNVNTETLSQDKFVKKEINFISDNYISIETKSNEKFSPSPVYSLLPLDNINSEKGISIRDLYDKDVQALYEDAYKKAYASVSETNKSKLSKYIDYSNFTLIRKNGHWVLQGMISPILIGGEPEKYDLNIRPNNILCNYDTLYIPWKLLKSEIPLLVDAFTSPDGSIAVIINNDELLVYKIEDMRLSEESLKRIQLENGEEVIMAEWCENEYVDKWDSAFNKSSSIIN